MLLDSDRDLNPLDSSVAHGEPDGDLGPSYDEEYVDESELQNARGYWRQKRVRDHFLSATRLDIDGVRNFYRKWRVQDEYIRLRVRPEFWERYGRKAVAVKAAKRGNDYAQFKMRQKFSQIKAVCQERDHAFFRAKDDVRRTPVLFVSLTFDPKRASLREAWENPPKGTPNCERKDVGYEFNRWMTGLREKYGRISILRAWDSQTKKNRGYPGVHVMLLFHDREFDVFALPKKRDGFTLWRVAEKEEFEVWPGFVDVEGVRTMSAVIRYIEKRSVYGTDKADDGEHGDLTLALTWLFRKRSFSLSRDLATRLSDLIRSLPISKFQVRLDGGGLSIWECLGLVGAGELGLDGSAWVVGLGSDLMPMASRGPFEG